MLDYGHKVCVPADSISWHCVWFSGGADLSDDSDIRQWVVALYFAMTTVTTVGYGDITAHSTVEQVSPGQPGIILGFLLN